jgi:hypothetical protein
MRAKLASVEWEEDGNTAHIILVEADRRQIYPAARAAILPVLQCSISLFISSIAQG